MKFSPLDWLVLAWCGVKMPTPEQVEEARDTRYSYRVRQVTTYYGVSYHAEYRDNGYYGGWRPITNEEKAAEARKGYGIYDSMRYTSYTSFDDESSATRACHEHAARQVVTTTITDLGKLP